MPAGVFGMVHGASTAVGLALVAHPLIKAVGFTGSLRGGRALFDAASRRPEPIPVYAEMGSSNPVFILPRALAARGEAVAQLAGHRQEHVFPVAHAPLAEQAHRRVPRAVLALVHPAPVRGERQG
jgi:acyl-CoA reductase-like NAD-dependent aldehyde dehydrogenase